jgi:hypothetical protein
MHLIHILYPLTSFRAKATPWISFSDAGPNSFRQRKFVDPSPTQKNSVESPSPSHASTRSGKVAVLGPAVRICDLNDWCNAALVVKSLSLMPQIRILEYQTPVCSVRSKLFLWASALPLLEWTSSPTMLAVHLVRLHVSLLALLALQSIQRIQRKQRIHTANVLILLAKTWQLHFSDANFPRRSYLLFARRFTSISA